MAGPHSEEAFGCALKARVNPRAAKVRGTLVRWTRSTTHFESSPEGTLYLDILTRLGEATRRIFPIWRSRWNRAFLFAPPSFPRDVTRFASIEEANRARAEATGGFVATYPDVCEFESTPQLTTPDAMIAAQLVLHHGEPWLVSLVGQATDSCRTESSGCFETLPCQCSYSPTVSFARVALVAEHLDDPTRRLRVDFPDLSYEGNALALPGSHLRLVASGGDHGLLFVAVAQQNPSSGGDDADTLLHYLKLAPE